MELLKIAILSLSSIVVLFILTKIMGNREMSQLTMFDYINSITIGSIAAEMATALESNFMQPLLAMVIYGLVTFLISFISGKSLKARRFISGKPRVLFNNGKLYYKNFKKSKLDINEFLMECRTNGYFNIADIQTAVLEPNGKLSILPINLKKPVTPEELNISPNQENLVFNVILDGQVLTDNLTALGKDLNWLDKELKKQKIKKINEVFLATCDFNNNLSVYTKIHRENSHDAFC